MDTTPEQRSMAARALVHASWAKCRDRSARTAPARAAQFRRFEDMVDPERVLEPEERAKRAESARKAELARMTLKSSQVRAARKAAREGGGRTS